MEAVAAVVESSSEAQVIATRGIGSHAINDPMLKALNDALLSGAGELAWRTFWKTQEERLGSDPRFADYIAPDRNSAAIFLAAYYDALE